MGLLGSSKKKKKETSKTITYVGEFKESKDKDGKTVDVKVSVYCAYYMHFILLYSHTFILCLYM